MTTAWFCAERDRQHDASGYDTEEAALRKADELARAGKMAVVWCAEVEG
jgi:hypothetical protein